VEEPVGKIGDARKENSLLLLHLCLARRVQSRPSLFA
jgi:hypothetical protein